MSVYRFFHRLEFSRTSRPMFFRVSDLEKKGNFVTRKFEDF